MWEDISVYSWAKSLQYIISQLLKRNSSCCKETFYIANAFLGVSWPICLNADEKKQKPFHFHKHSKRLSDYLVDSDDESWANQIINAFKVKELHLINHVYSTH